MASDGKETSGWAGKETEGPGEPGNSMKSH